jgi:hypothetical protein
VFPPYVAAVEAAAVRKRWGETSTPVFARRRPDPYGRNAAISWHFERDPIPYALETDWPVGTAGLETLHFRIGVRQDSQLGAGGLNMQEIVPHKYIKHGDGATVFRQGCKTGLEGIVSKRRDSPYRRCRSPDWLKLKCIIFCTEGARPHCGCKSVVAFKPAVGGFGAEAGRSAYDRRPACIIINGFCCRLVCLLRSADYRGVIMKKLTRERLFGGPKKAHNARARLARARFVIVAARERAAEAAQQSAGRPVTLRPTVLQRRRLADRLKAKSIRSAFLLRRPWMDGAASQPVRQ